MVIDERLFCQFLVMRYIYEWSLFTFSTLSLCVYIHDEYVVFVVNGMTELNDACSNDVKCTLLWNCLVCHYPLAPTVMKTCISCHLRFLYIWYIYNLSEHLVSCMSLWMFAICTFSQNDLRD